MEEENHELKSLEENPEIRVSSDSNQDTGDSAMEEDGNEECLSDQMVWDSRARVIPSGYVIPSSTGNFLYMFVKRLNELS